MQKLMFPMQMKSAGMNAIFNTIDPETGELKDPSLKKGAVIGFEKSTDINTEMREGIETQYLTRVQAALAGELPEDPALIAQLGEQEDALHESLRQQLGPGWQTSSPGIEAISKFEEGKYKLLDAARRGDLTLAEQLGQSRENVNLNRAQMGYAGALAGSQYGAQAAGRLAGGYGTAGSQQGNLRLASEQLRFGDMASRRAASAQREAGMWQGIGNVVGMTSYPWMQKWASDIRLKKNIEYIGDMNGHRFYAFDYILGGPRTVGVMAQEAMKYMPQAVKSFGEFLAVNYRMILGNVVNKGQV